MTTIPYPGIQRAALEIALDNGGINRTRSVEQQTRELGRWLNTQPAEILPAIDAWLASLSKEDLNIVCCAPEKERAALMADAPPFTDKFLEDYFEGVC